MSPNKLSGEKSFFAVGDGGDVSSRMRKFSMGESGGRSDPEVGRERDSVS
jgi:hypothetical protein